MNLKEKRQFYKLRSRLALLVLVILCLLAWIRNIYRDRDWLRSENMDLHSSINLNRSTMNKLYHQIDSLTKNIPDTTKLVSKKIKEKKKPESDTTTSKATDVVKKIQDTIQHKILKNEVVSDTTQ